MRELKPKVDEGWVSMRAPEQDQLAQRPEGFSWSDVVQGNLLEIHVSRIKALLKNIGVGESFSVEVWPYHQRQPRITPPATSLGEVATMTSAAADQKKQVINPGKVDIDFSSGKIIFFLDSIAIADEVESTHGIEFSHPRFAELYASGIENTLKALMQEMVQQLHQHASDIDPIMSFQEYLTNIGMLTNRLILPTFILLLIFRQVNDQKFNIQQIILESIGLDATFLIFFFMAFSSYLVRDSVNLDKFPSHSLFQKAMFQLRGESKKEYYLNQVFPKQYLEKKVIPTLVGRVKIACYKEKIIRSSQKNKS